MILQKIKKLFLGAAYALCRLLPVDRERVLFFSYYGEQYSGSPKYISRYLTEQTGVKVVWAFVDPQKYDLPALKKVRYGRFEYYYQLATAGTVITNYRMTDEFRKRRGQRYIQTWHSSLRLKMIEKDAEETLPANYVRMAKKDSPQIDYLLAGSRKSREIFEGAFWYDGTIVNSGTPQCDILLGDSTGVRRKAMQHFGIPENAHIALYAPTFRKDHDTSVYDLDTDALLSALRERFGGEWYLLMRLHPHLVREANCFRYSEKVLPATDYDDAQELLAAADVLVSDYSAIMFDYAVTKRPCILYTPDIERYTATDRKLYFEMNELPFPHFEKQTELFAAIRQFSETEYLDSVSRFLNAIGSYDDGRACQRISELISR